MYDDTFLNQQTKRIKRNFGVFILVVMCYLLLAIFIFNELFLAIIIGVPLYFFMGPKGFIEGIKTLRVQNVDEVIASFGDPYSTEDAINEEVENNIVYETKQVIVTKSWIIKKRWFGIDVVKISEIAWMKYLTRGTNQQNFMPSMIAMRGDAGETYVLQIHTQNTLLPNLEISSTHLHYYDDSQETVQQAQEIEEAIIKMADTIKKLNPSIVLTNDNNSMEP